MGCGPQDEISSEGVSAEIGARGGTHEELKLVSHRADNGCERDFFFFGGGCETRDVTVVSPPPLPPPYVRVHLGRGWRYRVEAG